MNMDINSPEVIKVLKFIYKNKRISSTEIDKKFPELDLFSIFYYLWTNDYIKSSHGSLFADSVISPGRLCGNIIFRNKEINKNRWKDRIIGFVFGILAGIITTAFTYFIMKR